MRFKCIYIELTNECGMACSFCPSRPKVARIMGLEDFSNVLAQIKGKTKIIALHVWGDPLILCNIEDYLNEALKWGFKVRLVTSGMPLVSHQPKLLAHKALLQLSISLNSIAGVSKSKKEAYFQALWDWCGYHVENKLSSFINLRLWKKPNDANTFVTEALERINTHFKASVPKEFENNQPFQLAPRVRFVSSRYFEWPSQNTPIVAPSICHGLCSQLGILSDLRVVPCCMDGDGALELGSLKNQSLDEVLRSNRVIKIKNGFEHAQVVEDMCKRCGFRERFV